MSDSTNIIAPIQSKISHRFVWVPETFNMKWLPEKLRKQKYLECAALIFSMIHYRKCDKRFDDEELVPISTEFLRNVVGKKWAVVLRDHLAKIGAIIFNKQYVVGKESSKYGVGIMLKGDKWVRLAVKDKCLLNRIAEHFAPPGPKGELEGRLFQCLASVKVDEEVFGLIDTLAETKGRNWWVEAVNAVERFNFGDFGFCRDRYGRLHSNLTNLNKEFRRFLAVGGQRLVEIDICNSQPLFFISVISQLLKVKTSSNPSSPLPPPLYDAHFYEPQDDVKDYIRLVQSDAEDFYEVMMRESQSKKTRDNFKTDFFRDVFYQKRGYATPAKDAFFRLFPTVAKKLTDLKAEDPNLPAHMMQREEASFVIDTCCKKLFAEVPGIWIGTIHDSILTTPEHEESVLNLMRREFGKIGLEPKLRITRY